jgi:large subunit ribosomal protein L15
MLLNEMSDNAGAVKGRMRVGRGIGSGKGKTCGRGVKGQKARSGVSIKGFEGGQMPLHRRLPKRGFNNIHALKLTEISLSRLQEAVDSGKLTAGSHVDAGTLKAAGVLKQVHDGVRVIATGTLTAKLNLDVYGASANAKAAIEAAGGSVKTVA